MSFDDQVRAALDSATTSLREHLEAELHALAQEVVRASMEERQLAVAAASQAATAEVRAQTEALVADVRSQAEAQVAQFRAAAHKHAEGLKRAAEGQIGELRKGLEELRAQAQQQLDAARRTAQDEIDKARAEVEKAHAEVETAHDELEKAHGETEWANAEIHKAKAEAEQARHDIDAARAEVEDVRNQAKSEIARAQAEADEVRKGAAAEAEDVREGAAAEAEQVLIARLAAAHALSEQKTTEAIERAQTDSHQSELSRAARLADAIRNLDEARGLSEVLERLVQSAGYEVDRAAVLLVKGDRLTGWRLAGFAPDGPSAKSIDLSIGEAGLAGAVLESHVSVSRPSDATDGPALPPFAADAVERRAMALPVRVGGEVVAVLYADAARPDAPSSDARWPAVLEVLVRHASRVLEAMTVQQAAGLSLPRSQRTVAGSDRTLLGGAQ